jgi:hypothetical protein
MMDNLNFNELQLPGASQPIGQNTSSPYGLGFQENSVNSALSGYDTHVVAAGDTLWNIAGQKTDSPLNWTGFKESDGSEFTGEEARRLQIGSKVYIPRDPLIGAQPEPIPDSITAPVSFKSQDVTVAPLQASNSSSNWRDEYNPFTIEKGDTLWDIAGQELNDPFDWIAIRDADGTNFTEEEARYLQIDSTVYLPKTLTEGESDNKTGSDVTVTLIEGNNDSSNTVSTGDDTTKEDDTATEGETGQNANSNVSNPPKTPDKPELPVEGKVSYKIESDNVAEGLNIDAGVIRGVVVDDELGSKISLNPDWNPETNDSSGDSENGDILKLTQNIEFSGFLKEVGAYWEAEILDGLAKWDTQNGFSFKLGDSPIYLSGLDAKLFDVQTGTPTTDFTFAVEGRLDSLVNAALKSQGKELNFKLPEVEAEVEYSAKIAWQAEIPKPRVLTPEFVPVYVNEPAPVQSAPAKESVRTFPNTPPVTEPVRTFPNTPPVMEPITNSQPVYTPSEDSVQIPSTQPIPETLPQPAIQISPSTSSSGIDVQDVSVAAIATGVVVIGGVAVYALTAPVSVPVTAAAFTIGAGLIALGGLFGGDNNKPTA